MDLPIEVVKIKSDGAFGYQLINKDDYDPKMHTLYDEPESKPVAKPAKPKSEAKPE